MTHKTLITHVDVVTLDEQSSILRDAAIAIEDRQIVAVGEAPADFQADEVIDGYNHVALPGFVNTHCHGPMTLVRGWAEDLPFPRWLNEKMWVAESALTSDDVYWGESLAVCEMLRTGCVAAGDRYFYMDRVAEVMEASGLKAALAWGVFGLGPDKEIGATLEDALAFSDRWQGRGDGRLKFMFGPHSPYVCPPDFLRRIAGLAAERGLGVHIHLSESQQQVDNSMKAHGKTPVAHLESLGLFDGPCVAAHCLTVSDEDLDILAAHRVNVAHTPITYMKLAMGVNDLSRFLKRGINVAIGTDGAGSSADMDMAAQLRQAVMLQKHEQRNPEALPGDTALRMATQNGARALGFENSGVLAPGWAADLILIDFDKPHLTPRHNLVANLVHSAKGSDVTHVIVDGRLLYREGELLTLDEERILREAERHAFRLVGSEMQLVREYRA